MNSFSTAVKIESLSFDVTKVKKCCLYSFIYGLFYDSKEENSYRIVKLANTEYLSGIEMILNRINHKNSIDIVIYENQIRINKAFFIYSTNAENVFDIFKCSKCQEFFLKGVFLVKGTVNDPAKSYRAEFVFNEGTDTDFIGRALSNFNFKLCRRNNKIVLYAKGSDIIEDFLAYIGANNASFKVINNEILKEIRNNANRATNCDSANISKSVRASDYYTSIIDEMKKDGSFELLPELLKETANKRAEFSDLNFEELGKEFNPPISKAGLCHRLKKISSFYEKRKEKK